IRTLSPAKVMWRSASRPAPRPRPASHERKAPIPGKPYAMPPAPSQSSESGRKKAGGLPKRALSDDNRTLRVHLSEPRIGREDEGRAASHGRRGDPVGEDTAALRAVWRAGGAGPTNGRAD